jgi:hypothetical protein
VANAGLLTEAERENLQITVVVSDGSSNLVADLAQPAERLLKSMIRKMTGRQALIELGPKVGDGMKG